MKSKFIFVVAVLFSLSLIATTATANETVLANLGDSSISDGNTPVGSLVHDEYGNLYGTTVVGGTHSFGTVFVVCAPNLPSTRLPCTPNLPNPTEIVLYNFQGAGFLDGARPYSTLVSYSVVSRLFTLYGTTHEGGNTGCAYSGSAGGCGTVFELCAPSSSGGCSTTTSWQEKTIWKFSSGAGGAIPYAGVITDGAGTLYGTTMYGGMGTCNVGNTNFRCGTVFRLKHNATFSTWTRTVLHKFNGDGAVPLAGLCCNSLGTIFVLYGTTYQGGAGNGGVVFSLQNSPGFPTTTLYTFCSQPGCADGAKPMANVVFDSATPPRMYGTTFTGGLNNLGTVFQLSPPFYNAETALYSFCLYCSVSGANPHAGLLVDANNNLYGTTVTNASCCGGVFEWSPPFNSNSLTILHAFGLTDGGDPYSGVISVNSILYGTTTAGGQYGGGVVYSIP